MATAANQHDILLAFTRFLFVFTDFPLVVAPVYSCCTRIHFCSLVFVRILLMFTHVLLVFTRIYRCSPTCALLIFIGVRSHVLYSCSLVFLFVWCFRLDHFTEHSSFNSNRYECLYCHNWAGF